MQSFQLSISPNKRTAGRFIASVRRALQKALVEERASRGLTQSDVARIVGVHRSVVSRELRGFKDLTLGRVGELAFALGREPVFTLETISLPAGSNEPLPVQPEVKKSSATATARAPFVETGALQSPSLTVR